MADGVDRIRAGIQKIHGGEYGGVESTFHKLLRSFLEKVNARDSFRTFPPMVGEGEPVDLFKLFLAVRRRGGYSAVSENRLWNLVAEECGLGLIGNSSIKLVYVKFLDAFERFLVRFVESKDSKGRESVSGLLGLNEDHLEGFLLELDTSNAGNPQLEKSGNGGEDLQNGSSNQLVIFGEVNKLQNQVDIVMADSENVVEGNSGAEKKGGTSDNEKRGSHKRKRQSVSRMLNWLTKVARDPRDPSVGSLPERSKWDSCSVDEFWKQVLVFRGLTLTPSGGDSSAEDSHWQKTQKMHPSMYADGERSGKNLGGRSSDSPTPGSVFDLEVQSHARIGRDFQAEVPEWREVDRSSELKWLGTRVWPPEKKETSLIERDPIGKGRQESCGCQVPGSTSCVQFHVNEKKSKLKFELVSAFYLWKFHFMGESVAFYWMDEDKKLFDSILKSRSTDDENVWEELRKRFPKKTRGDLVSYYFNVFILQQRAHQNRITPTEINSDDEGGSEHPIVLAPKKPPRKRSR